jgi:transporter family-2 protein
MNLLLFFVAFGAGIAVSFQAAINSQMAAAVGANSVVAALVSFLCGTAVLAVVAFARGGLPDALAALPQQPLWKFSGGFLGAAFIFCTVMLVPRIGLLNLVVLVIAGQLITSMAIDHFGLVNVAMRGCRRSGWRRRRHDRRRGAGVVRRPHRPGDAPLGR